MLGHFVSLLYERLAEFCDGFPYMGHWSSFKLWTVAELGEKSPNGRLRHLDAN